MKSITCRHCGTPRKAKPEAIFPHFCHSCHRIDDQIGRVDRLLEYIVVLVLALVIAGGVAYILIDFFDLFGGNFRRTIPETAEIEFVNRP